MVHPSPTDTGGGGRSVIGRVVRDTESGYSVSLPGGTVAEVGDEHVALVSQREAPAAALPRPAGHSLVTERTILAAAVGGEDVKPGMLPPDVDIRGVYQAPTSSFWALSKPPKHVAGPGPGWFSWEVERFCELAIKASPTCLELLWSRSPIWVSEAGCELLDLRGAFLSRTISKAYAAHVLAQFDKLEKNDRQQEEQRWKQAANLLRLLMDGVALLYAGDVFDSVGERRDRLAAVRSGQTSWDDVQSWRSELQLQLDEAAGVTFLPAEPDVDRIDAWLSDLRRRDTRE